MKQFFIKNKHFLLILYFPFYLAAFHFLESIKTDKIHILDCALDHWIPFLEIFIIPYLMWFAFMGITGFYFMFLEKDSFCRMMYFGMIGMSLFLVISWLYPNGLELRPETFARDNVFTDLVRWIYSMDTATNVLPSIHVFNSVGVCCAIQNSRRLGAHPLIQKGSKVLTVLIILSTMFIKQHSVVDVITGLALSYITWELIYNRGAVRLVRFTEEAVSTFRYHRRRTLQGLNK